MRCEQRNSGIAAWAVASELWLVPRSLARKCSCVVTGCVDLTMDERDEPNARFDIVQQVLYDDRDQ